MPHAISRARELMHNGTAVMYDVLDGKHVYASEFNLPPQHRVDGGLVRLLGPMAATIKALRKSSKCDIIFNDRSNESFRKNHMDFPPIVTITCKADSREEGWTKITMAITGVRDLWDGTRNVMQVMAPMINLWGQNGGQPAQANQM